MIESKDINFRFYTKSTINKSQVIEILKLAQTEFDDTYHSNSFNNNCVNFYNDKNEIELQICINRYNVPYNSFGYTHLISFYKYNDFYEIDNLTILNIENKVYKLLKNNVEHFCFKNTELAMEDYYD